MKRQKKINPVLLGVAGAAMLGSLAAVPAGATIIYQDNFTGGTVTSPVTLQGATPSPTDTGSATWSLGQAGAIDTNGSGAYVQTGDQYTATLPVSLSQLGTYALTVTITPPAGSSTNWLRMGFDNLAAGGQYQSTAGYAWLLYRDSGGAQTFYGGGTSNGVPSSTNATPGAPDTFTISIDTITGAINYSDTLNLVTGHTGTLTSAQIAAIGYVDIGDYLLGSGSFKNLELTYTAPEPATLGLMAVGGLGLLIRRKRKPA